MNFNFKQKYKNATPINFFNDFVGYNGSRSGLIITYILALSPIITSILFFFFVGVLDVELIFLTGLNMFPLTLGVLSIVLFLAIDLYRNIDKKIYPHPIKFYSTYYEVFFLTMMLVWIVVASFLGPKSSTVFNIYLKYGRKNYLQESTIFFLAYALIFACCLSVKNKSIKERILFCLTASSTFMCVLNLVFFDRSKYIFGDYCNTNWAVGFVNSNHFGYFLTVTTMLIAGMFVLAKSNKVKIASGTLFVLHCFVLMFNDTLGCLLALIITLIAMPVIVCIKQKKFNWFAFVPIAVFMAISFVCIPLAKHMGSTYLSLASQLENLFKEVFSIAQAPLAEENLTAGTSRWDLWLDAVDAIKNYPIFGDGWVLEKPHNEYLQYSAHYGLPTLIFYLVALIIIAVKALKNLKALSNTTLCLLGSVLAYLISAFFGNTMPHTIVFFILVLAFAITNIEAERKKNSNPINAENMQCTKEETQPTID